MARIIVELVLIVLSIGFVAWMTYVFWLGFKTFFKIGITNADHRKQRGRTAPNKILTENNK